MSRAELTIGEALVGLLESYGVDTVFGIPGVHNIELYRALPRSNIRHILPRHEQGAGFMADGYARATGKPGVCFVITGPGLTNILTPMGQAWSDSVPMLVIATALHITDSAQGRGHLHEMRNQRGAAQSVTAYATTANTSQDVCDAIALAFTSFATQRPRPHYIEIPIDVMSAPAEGAWQAQRPPAPLQPPAAPLADAAKALAGAIRPVIMVGGGARDAASDIIAVAEKTGALLLQSAASKGIIAPEHPQNAGTVLTAPEAMAEIAEADVVVIAGSEAGYVDRWYQPLEFNGTLIRIDVDTGTMTRSHRVDIPILADATAAFAGINAKLAGHKNPDGVKRAITRVKALKKAAKAGGDAFRADYNDVLPAIRAALPGDTIIASDMAQIAYSANEIFPVSVPRCWLHPHGFGTLGYALPAACGARAAFPERPVAVLVGDYGLQYTINELATAAELGGSMVILLWNNARLAMIHDAMAGAGIQPNAVICKNPDFSALAKAYDCHAARPATLAGLSGAIAEALAADRPTLIEMAPGIAGDAK